LNERRHDLDTLDRFLTFHGQVPDRSAESRREARHAADRLAVQIPVREKKRGTEVPLKSALTPKEEEKGESCP
jgi:hypothetical protein